MPKSADRIPGVSVDVEELLGIRGHLSGLALAGINRRASYRSGARGTRSRGRGMEYEESRAYIAGDDMRTMDWRVMARTGEAHTKLFAEEKERSFVLAIDFSASMYYGTRYAFKTRAAAMVAAQIGWIASLSGDRIGGLLATPAGHHEIRPGKSGAGLLGLFRHLADASRIEQPAVGAASRLNFLLRELKRVIKPGSIVALISDFVGLDAESHVLVAALIEHSDLNLYWIYDDSEIEAWPAGHYPLRLDRAGLSLDMPAAAAWLETRQRQHRAGIEAMSRAYAIPLLPVSCNREITAQIAPGRGAL